MITENDSNKLAGAAAGAQYFVRDLRELVACDEPLLSDLALEILQSAVLIEQRLNRLVSVTKVQP